MPTYEYACKSCGEHTEAVQSFTDDPLTVCPACSGPLRKVFGVPGIAFKGSGFYKTDSRVSANGSSTKSAELGSSETSAPGDSGAKDGANGDGAKSDGAKSDGAKAPAETKASGGDTKPAKSNTKPSSTPAPTSSS